MKFVTIGLIQTKVGENIKNNVDKTIGLIEQAVKKGTEIVALQELFQTPYFPQWEGKNKSDYAEELSGYTVTRMKETAKRLGITLVVPFNEKKGAKYLNTAVGVSKDGKLPGQCHKIINPILLLNHRFIHPETRRLLSQPILSEQIRS